MTLRAFSQVIKQAALVAACLHGALLLGGCATTSVDSPYQKSDGAVYKHMLSISGDMADEVSALIETSALGEAVLISDGSMPSGLNMRLQLMVTNQSQLNTRPALAGKLVRQSITPLYTLRYTLMDGGGKMLDATDVRHSGTTHDMYLPQLDTSLMQPNALDKKMLVEKLTQSILPSIQNQPWEAIVLNELQLTHVLIAGGQELGLSYGDILQTKTAPIATLQVVTFETTPDGQSRAALRLIEGRLPNVGRVLIPAIQ